LQVDVLGQLGLPHGNAVDHPWFPVAVVGAVSRLQHGKKGVVEHHRTDPTGQQLPLAVVVMQMANSLIQAFKSASLRVKTTSKPNGIVFV